MRRASQAREIGAVFDVLRRAELERNPWRFAIRLTVLRAIDTDTMLLAPSVWTASTTYFAGSLVSYDDLTWISRIPDNVNYEPGSTTAWALYFGPLTVDAYDSETAYYAGELVYSADGDGTNRVYLSLQSSNEDDPATATAWAATTTYKKNDVVTYSAVAYMSLIDLNTNNTPSAAPQIWDDATTYVIGNQVGASDGVIYTSSPTRTSTTIQLRTTARTGQTPACSTRGRGISSAAPARSNGGRSAARSFHPASRSPRLIRSIRSAPALRRSRPRATCSTCRPGI
jgi:hypothetical protein